MNKNVSLAALWAAVTIPLVAFQAIPGSGTLPGQRGGPPRSFEPAKLWTFHKTVPLSDRDKNLLSIPIGDPVAVHLRENDGDRRARVKQRIYVTDIQICRASGYPLSLKYARLVNKEGVLWYLEPVGIQKYPNLSATRRARFETPLLLESGSGLRLEIAGDFTSGARPIPFAAINVIGRVVTAQ